MIGRRPPAVATVAFSAAAVTAAWFAVNFFSPGNPLPGYGWLAWPGILATRGFSEELGFAEKLLILLAAQYVFYGGVWWLLRVVLSRIKAAG